MRRAILGLAATAMLLAGCASDGWFKLKKEAFPVANAKNPVVRILAVWQVGDGQGPDGLSTRGFAGQVFFLDAKDQIPAKVDGETRIYVFDDQGPPEQRDTPVHQFDYPRDSWKVRETKTKMGPAYAVFVPYTRKGSHKATCSIRVRFTPADGTPPVFSDMAQVTLPGRDGSPQEQFALERSRARTAEHLAGNPDTAQPKTEANHLPADPNATQPDSRTAARGDTIRPTTPPSPPAPARAPLTEADRQRLVTEALARAAQEGLPVAGAAVRQPAPRRQPLLRQASYDDDSDEIEADNTEDIAPAPRTTRRAAASSTSRRTVHPLSRERQSVTEDDEDESDRDEVVQQPVRRHRSDARHPLLRDRDSRDDEATEYATEEDDSAPVRQVTRRLSRSAPPPDEAPRRRSRQEYEDEELLDAAVAREEALDLLEQEAMDELARMTAQSDRPRRQR